MTAKVSFWSGAYTEQARASFHGGLVKALLRMSQVLPVRRASTIGAATLPRLATRWAVHDLAMAQVGRAFPALSPRQTAQLVHEMWQHLGRSFAEFPHTRAIVRDPSLFELRADSLREALSEGRGCLVITGHFSNFDAGAHGINQAGMPLWPVLMLEQNAAYTEELVRSRAGLFAGHILAGANTLVQIARVLQSGAAVGINLDRHQPRGLPSTFFGQPVLTSTSALEVAVREGAALVMGRNYRLPSGTIVTETGPRLYPRAGLGRKEVLVDLVQRINTQFEQWVTEYPAQWHWIHRRWRSEEAPLAQVAP